MKTVGIICEYNPFHLGHLYHIGKTKEAMGGDAYIVCVMSGNFVQRGDVAIFNKHARAKMAVLSGADIVIELPAPYALLSASGFAGAGVHLLDSLGVCDYLSFGSESGSLEALREAAHIISTDQAQEHIKKGLDMGLPYAAAQQKAADALLGERAGVFRTPNNTLGIEYLRMLEIMESSMRPMTVKREGGEHDGSCGCSASAIRKQLVSKTVPAGLMPESAAMVCREETAEGRGPVLMNDLEQAALSRLRAVKDYTDVPGSTDGLDRRFLRTAPNAPSIDSVLEGIKSKRFAMSRIRRMMMNAILGITINDIKAPPPYIRVLAMNKRGMRILKNARNNAVLPIITKPASVYKLGKQVLNLFNLESSATDFYALAYKKEQDREGGGEWRQSPIVIAAPEPQSPEVT